MMHKAARAFVEPLLHQLRHGESSRVITRLEQILSEPSLQGHPAYDNSADPQLERQIQYFLNHRDHLDYQAVAQRGAPIGSGAVESPQFAATSRAPPKLPGLLRTCQRARNAQCLDDHGWQRL